MDDFIQTCYTELLGIIKNQNTAHPQFTNLLRATGQPNAKNLDASYNILLASPIGKLYMPYYLNTNKTSMLGAFRCLFQHIKGKSSLEIIDRSVETLTTFTVDPTSFEINRMLYDVSKKGLFSVLILCKYDDVGALAELYANILSTPGDGDGYVHLINLMLDAAKNAAKKAQNAQNAQNAGTSGIKKVRVLGRLRNATKVGRKFMVTYMGKRMSLTDARKREKAAEIARKN